MNDKVKRVTKLCGFLFLAALVVGLAAQPLSAQVTIPEGSVIDSAVFWVYVLQPNNRPVTLHRVNGMWEETVVTHNSWVSSGNSYDPLSVGGFTADAIGWKSVDITGLVQAWAAGLYPNYGIAMVEQDAGAGAYAYYRSSDYTGVLTNRPKLVIGYIPPGGILTYVTIQRPGTPALQVVDTFINPREAASNYGAEPWLSTNHVSGIRKFSVVKFIFEYTPGGCPGTGTPGYWMNHPEAWANVVITFCGLPLDHDIAISWMKNPVAGDKWFTLFPAWLAAKLNARLGCSTVCPPDINIGAAITEAEAWLCTYQGIVVPAGGKNSPWREAEGLYFLLDQYNNGLLCVPHRD